MPKKKRKPNNPGQGRPSVHGEPTAMFPFRAPLSLIQVAEEKAEREGITKSMALIAMAKQAKEYKDKQQ